MPQREVTEAKKKQTKGRHFMKFGKGFKEKRERPSFCSMEIKNV